MMDPFLLEAIINGFLLGGVFALLALGLNLVFGVIDVVWLCYAELVMLGMYLIFFAVTAWGMPFIVAFAGSIALVAVLGVVLHLTVIRPLLGAPPINQLLATGGVLFFLQSLATLVFSTEFRNVGVRLPILELGEIFIDVARLAGLVGALIGTVALFLFLKRSYIGTAMRAIAQDREVMTLMGVDPKRIFIITSAMGGALAGLGSCLLVVQTDVHPHVGLSYGLITFLVCVMGGLGNMIGGIIAAFIMGIIISVGGYFTSVEESMVIAFAFFIAVVFIRPQGLFAS